jgi:hypothetical protein
MEFKVEKFEGEGFCHHVVTGRLAETTRGFIIEIRAITTQDNVPDVQSRIRSAVVAASMTMLPPERLVIEVE